MQWNKWSMSHIVASHHLFHVSGKYPSCRYGFGFFYIHNIRVNIPRKHVGFVQGWWPTNIVFSFWTDAERGPLHRFLPGSLTIWRELNCSVLRMGGQRKPRFEMVRPLVNVFSKKNLQDKNDVAILINTMMLINTLLLFMFEVTPWLWSKSLIKLEIDGNFLTKLPWNNRASRKVMEFREVCLKKDTWKSTNHSTKSWWV